MNLRQKELQYVLLNKILEFSKDILQVNCSSIKSEDNPTIENPKALQYRTFKNIRARM